MCGCAGLDPGKAWNQTGRRVKGPRPLSGKGLKALCWFPHRCRAFDNMNFTRWGKGQAANFGQPRRITSIQQTRERLRRSLFSFVSADRYRAREGGSRPRPPSVRRVPPAPSACGPYPCPPCAAAVPPPARPACGSPGNVAAGRRRLAACGGSCYAASAAAQVCAPAALASRQPLLGAPLPQSKAKTSRLRRALLCSFPSPVAA